jgi:hypothetical protein
LHIRFHPLLIEIEREPVGEVVVEGHRLDWAVGGVQGL